MEITCPECGGLRYAEAAGKIRRIPSEGEEGLSLPELMALTVDQAIEKTADLKKVRQRLENTVRTGAGLSDTGRGPRRLCPGGEAQRLKLAAEMGRAREDTVFVFDEPTVGLHPLDVRSLTGIFQKLIDSGATVIVIEHDLGHDRQCGLCNRHGTRRRKGRRPNRRLRNAGGYCTG